MAGFFRVGDTGGEKKRSSSRREELTSILASSIMEGIPPNYDFTIRLSSNDFPFSIFVRRTEPIGRGREAKYNEWTHLKTYLYPDDLGIKIRRVDLYKSVGFNPDKVHKYKRGFEIEIMFVKNPDMERDYNAKMQVIRPPVRVVLYDPDEEEYDEYHGEHRVDVSGNPIISKVETIATELTDIQRLFQEFEQARRALMEIMSPSASVEHTSSQSSIDKVLDEIDDEIIEEEPKVDTAQTPAPSGNILNNIANDILSGNVEAISKYVNLATQIISLLGMKNDKKNADKVREELNEIIDKLTDKITELTHANQELAKEVAKWKTLYEQCINVKTGTGSIPELDDTEIEESEEDRGMGVQL